MPALSRGALPTRSNRFAAGGLLIACFALQQLHMQLYCILRRRRKGRQQHVHKSKRARWWETVKDLGADDRAGDRAGAGEP